MNQATQPEKEGVLKSRPDTFGLIGFLSMYSADGLTKGVGLGTGEIRNRNRGHRPMRVLASTDDK